MRKTAWKRLGLFVALAAALVAAGCSSEGSDPSVAESEGKEITAVFGVNDLSGSKTIYPDSGAESVRATAYLIRGEGPNGSVFPKEGDANTVTIADPIGGEDKLWLVQDIGKKYGENAEAVKEDAEGATDASKFRIKGVKQGRWMVHAMSVSKVADKYYRLAFGAFGEQKYLSATSPTANIDIDNLVTTGNDSLTASPDAARQPDGQGLDLDIGFKKDMVGTVELVVNAKYQGYRYNQAGNVGADSDWVTIFQNTYTTAEDGTGSFAESPAAKVDTVTVSAFDSASTVYGDDGTAQAAYTGVHLFDKMMSGSYLIQILLKENGKVIAGAVDAVRILENQKSSGDIALTIGKIDTTYTLTIDDQTSPSLEGTLAKDETDTDASDGVTVVWTPSETTKTLLASQSLTLDGLTYDLFENGNVIGNAEQTSATMAKPVGTENGKVSFVISGLSAGDNVIDLIVSDAKLGSHGSSRVTVTI